MKTQLLKRVRINYKVLEFIEPEEGQCRFIAYHKMIDDDSFYSNSKQNCIDWIQKVVGQKYFLYFYITNSRRRLRKPKPTTKNVWYEPTNN